MNAGRRLSWDWYDGAVPDNVRFDGAYIETAYSFRLFRSQAALGVQIGRGAAVYPGTMFDVGLCGEVRIGEYALINGCRFVCDACIEIGAHALISWNVVMMDNYRVPLEPAQRRRVLRQLALRTPAQHLAGDAARPIRIQDNVWIGFDVCVLPGVVIGEGSVVGARSVVAHNVEPYTVVAGNPARVIRRLQHSEVSHG